LNMSISDFIALLARLKHSIHVVTLLPSMLQFYYFYF
jgi:hypothetical protein